MRTLLRLNASARAKASYSNQIGDYFLDYWLSKYPLGKVLTRDLAEEPIPHLSNKVISAFMQEDNLLTEETVLSDDLIEELKDADEILICSPLYNLTLPSTLKTYIDHVVRSEHTFKFHRDGPVGLLSGKKATIITSKGGLSSTNGKDDFLTDYLIEILAFIGITATQVISIEGTSLDSEIKQRHLDAAIRQLHRLFNPVDDTVWQGEFSREDKKAIEVLRDSQANAIVDGNAGAYANLCTDEIRLLIPGYEIVNGREQFIDVETKLFSNTLFAAFQKYPELIQRNGNRVIEIGCQKVSTYGGSAQGGVYSAEQKYIHSYQLTDLGWRYDLLMSNESNSVHQERS